jgi:integral membrane protein (TIGR00529 family)
VSYSFQLALIAGVFAVTVIAVNRGTLLPYAVSLSAILIAAITRLSPGQFIVLARQVLTDRMTLDLLVAVVLIRWLGDSMNSSGSLSRSSELLERIVGDLRVVAAVIPMLLGLLMVPGGAVLSAPTVEQLTDDMNFEPSKQAAINLIFRHVGQIFFPVSASLIMLTSIVGVNLAYQSLCQLPMAVAVGLFSFHFYFSSAEYDTKGVAGSDNRLQLLKNLIIELSPILLILVIFALTQQIAWALVVGIIWTFYQSGFTVSEILASFQLKASLESMLLIIGTMIIRGILQDGIITEVFSMPAMQASFAPLIISLLPWIIGFFTGSVVAAVSIAGPLLLSLISNGTGAHFFCASIFMGAFGGYLVSPVHLCLSLTAEYYDVSLGKLYQNIWVPAGTFLACAFVSSFLFRLS